MDVTRRRRQSDRSGWAILSAPRNLVLYMVVIELGTVALAIASTGWSGFAPKDAGLALLLALVAIAYEEASRKLAQLQIRLSASFRADMTSVWIIAGIVILPAAHVSMLIIVISAYVWFRQQRPAGEVAYRKMFVAATVVAGALLGGGVARQLSGTSGASIAVDSARGAFGIVVAIVVFTAVNRLLVTVVLLLDGIPMRSLVGSKNENLIEIATLSLGAMIALAVMIEPWLILLVLAPMITLQRGALVRELETAAITDAKTGLLNAIAWEQLAQRELDRSIRAGKPIAVLIVDIDLFKNVNDRYGHLNGDTVLAGIGQRIRSALRDYDGMGRFGGEEFVAVLPDSDEQEALLVAERVRLRVNELRILDLVPGVADQKGHGVERLSVSVGVATLRPDLKGLNELLHAADQALYCAKRNGRNQVQFAKRGVGMPDIETNELDTVELDATTVITPHVGLPDVVNS